MQPFWPRLPRRPNGEASPRLTRRAPATCPLPRPASRWPPELTEGAREERGGVLLEFKFKETIRTCLNQTGAKVSLNWTRAIFYPSRIAWRGGLFGGGPDPAPWTATHVLARRRSRLPPHGRAVAFPFRLLPERRGIQIIAAAPCFGFRSCPPAPPTRHLRATCEPPRISLRAAARAPKDCALFRRPRSWSSRRRRPRRRRCRARAAHEPPTRPSVPNKLDVRELIHA